MTSLLPWRRLQRLTILTIVVIALVMVTRLLLWQPLLHSGLAETHKCPACFGSSLCEHMDSGAIYLTGSSRVRFLNYMDSEKNVYFGKYRNKTVVLKKLASDNELETLDREMCGRVHVTNHCNVTHAIEATNVTNIWSLIRKVSPDITSCPSDRLLDLILDTYMERSAGQVLSSRERRTLVTTLQVNPEPIILQMFPPSKGWPFPRYYGACGRLVVIEHGGETLSDLYSAPWWQRVKLAQQVMKIAELFTNNDSGFRLYWLDMGLDNLAVTSGGQVKVIDAEHILMVDKKKFEKEQPNNWRQPLVTNYAACVTDNGFAQCLHFDTESLCSHVTSDINYYAACRLMLIQDGTAGLLHDIPHQVDRKHKLSALIEECIQPRSSLGRFVVKDKLLNVLTLLSRGDETPQSIGT